MFLLWLPNLAMGASPITTPLVSLVDPTAVTVLASGGPGDVDPTEVSVVAEPVATDVDPTATIIIL